MGEDNKWDEQKKKVMGMMRGSLLSWNLLDSRGQGIDVCGTSVCSSHQTVLSTFYPSVHIQYKQ